MTDRDRLFDLIDDKEVIQVTRDMVTIPSVTTHEGRGMLEYLERWFDDLGIPYREYETADRRANFFADFGAVSGPGRASSSHQGRPPTAARRRSPWAASRGRPSPRPPPA